MIVGEPPMQMQLVLRLSFVGIDPYAAGPDDHGRRSEDLLEHPARLVGMFVALDRDAVAVHHHGTNGPQYFAVG